MLSMEFPSELMLPLGRGRVGERILAWVLLSA